jgi:predicted nucleotidyltransferase
MKLDEKDRQQIVSAAKAIGVRAVYVFGSVLDDAAEPQDIDLAVEGVPPGMFFRFYGRLMRSLSKPVDLVDLDCRNAVTDLIAKDAVKIHG